MLQLQTGRSYLLVGSLTSADLSAFLPIDRLEVDATELGVKELRSVLAAAHERPYGERRLLLIRQADELSEICQNTLLKTLEEPPAKLTVILEVNSVEPLLPTVRSRLDRVNRLPASLGGTAVLPTDATAVAKILQSAKDRRALIALLRQELSYRLSRLADETTPYRLAAIEQAILRLEHNCNQKLTIDRLLLQWTPNPGKN